MDAIFYEAFKEEEKALKQYLPVGVQAVFTSQTIQEAKDKTPPAKLISVRTQSQIPLEWAEQIEGILTRSQGYDHLLEYLKHCGKKIPCGYLEGYCAVAVAEHAIMVMMILMKKLKNQIKNFNTFNRDNLTGAQARGQNALVVGVGKIGSQIVDLVHGVKMFAKGVDIEERIEDVQYVSLEEGIKGADVIICALPLTKETKGMLDYERLKQAQPGLILINISRGEITPVEDLKQLLDEGILGGLSLDVYPQEKELAHLLRGTGKATDRSARIIMELKDRENCLFTPHNAFNTAESLNEKARHTAEALRYFQRNKTFPCAI